MWFAFLWVGVLILLPMRSVRAVDGVIEIHPEAGGTLPIVIDQPGSYVMTTDLLLPTEDDTGLVVMADGVILDLNGFSVSGPNTCAPTGGTPPTTCTLPGTGVAISAGAASYLTVRNGVVRGAGDDGIVAGDFLRLEDVTVAENGGDGVAAQESANVLRNSVVQNGGLGVSAGAEAVVAQNVLSRNGLGALNLGMGSSAHSNSGVSQVPPRFQLVGFSTTTLQGNAGILAHTLACHADFGAGTRACTTAEVLQTTQVPAGLSGDAWVRPSFVPVTSSTTLSMDATGLNGAPTALSCEALNGISVDADGDFTAGRPCVGSTRKVACCGLVAD